MPGEEVENMPKTKKTKVNSPKKDKKATTNNASLKQKVTPSYTSLLYGIITVFVLFALIFAGLRNFTHKAPTPDIKNGIQTVNQQPIQRTYTVQEGDSLWTIAEKEYNDGFQWTKIADANKLVSPGAIDKGMKLVIPEQPKVVAQAEVTVTPSPTPKAQPTTEPNNSEVMTAQTTKGGLPVSGTMSPQTNGAQNTAITGNSYTVQSGDNLWDIAVRAYGDGYRWVEIAQANNLANPGLIFSGNVFTIPR